MRQDIRDNVKLSKILKEHAVRVFQLVEKVIGRLECLHKESLIHIDCHSDVNFELFIKAQLITFKSGKLFQNASRCSFVASLEYRLYILKMHKRTPIIMKRSIPDLNVIQPALVKCYRG